MKIKFFLTAFLYSIIITFIANGYIFLKEFPKTIFCIIIIFLLINIFAGISLTKVKNKRMKICIHGSILLCSFYTTIILSFIYHIFLAFQTIPNNYKVFIWSLCLSIGINLVIFWNGIICIYLTSIHLGYKWRIMGILCGMIPIVNFVVLFKILKIITNECISECIFEAEKEQINLKRKNKQICATKYPILLVHGVFFRDTKLFNYWGRIPKELEFNGAKIFYGNHSSAASIADSAAELKSRITEILNETGTKKLNIIAHSKGGLDCRYAISKLGIGNCVASLTTVNTPHRGCLFADYLLNKVPENIKNKIASTYNFTLKKLGEASPDFISAVSDLTDSHCKILDSEMPAPKDIYCQSIGSVLSKGTNGQFPLNISYHLVNCFSGENDGLVSEASFKWGEKYTLLKTEEKRGISHADVIDLNRENIKGFDVREFYVNLVADLKNKGL